MSLVRKSVKELDAILVNSELGGTNKALHQYYRNGLDSTTFNDAYMAVLHSNVPHGEKLAIVLIACNRKMNGSGLFTNREEKDWRALPKDWHSHSEEEFRYFLAHVDEFYAKVRHSTISRYNKAIELINNH